ncbi:ClpB protein [Geomicrobium sp. JCM 19037]|uniref:hypothetical protein n=1 Tax=Geomicrobium sp. JCM 19037 TaxID=1460634 RepID=UPI00045F236F|nr:hypothetical protein [Geomicrobium sp. JCM 19037]GAK02268.1 ClpB protein [Geomicrobium sp. JCM 19037]
MPFINDKLNHYETNGEEKKPVTKDAGSRYRFDVAHVMDKLQSRIFGQEHVMANMEDMLSLVKADISDTTRPLYTGLFLGPTGVAKPKL